MCIFDFPHIRMDFLRWRRKREVTSSMDGRFGDPSISAPTQGSWNEMPPLRPVKTEYSPPQLSDKAGRFKSFVRSQTVEAPDYSVGSSVERANFPRHPMVDMQNHQRSISVDRIHTEPRSDARQRSNSSNNNHRPRLSSSPGRHRGSYDSYSDSADDEDDAYDRNSIDRRDMAQRNHTSNQSREDNRGAQNKRSKTPRHHKSPPLSSTAVMRRCSSQSESARTYSSTPSTASFGSRRTSSVTTPGMHGFSGSAVPPQLREEEHSSSSMPPYEHSPPMPSYRVDRAVKQHVSASSSPYSASHSSSRGHGHPRGGRPTKRQHTVPIGPQELVPSNDELWGY